MPSTTSPSSWAPTVSPNPIGLFFFFRSTAFPFSTLQEKWGVRPRAEAAQESSLFTSPFSFTLHKKVHCPALWRCVPVSMCMFAFACVFGQLYTRMHKSLSICVDKWMPISPCDCLSVSMQVVPRCVSVSVCQYSSVCVFVSVPVSCLYVLVCDPVLPCILGYVCVYVVVCASLCVRVSVRV